MGFYSWLMAQGYDLAIDKTEQRCLSQWRRELLTEASGGLLEIGAGTGMNLPYYPSHLSQITLSEPDPHMRAQLQKKLTLNPLPSSLVTDWPAEQLDLPDHSIDTMVSTLVLCSVTCTRQTLQELYRVLRPGGQLLFIEHVVAAQKTTVRWQKLWEPAWRCCCGNCHLTRDTLYSMEETGLVIEQLTESDIVGAPAIVRRALRGRARKPLISSKRKQQAN